ncbi:hypothetical protein [Klebsiella phage VLC4]|uniref:Uncharacterized protein n=2 Tax=Drulisvirus TaxID=1920774 RepID=A0A6B9I918_9CAUD|nr:hypothetical protein [Klebsiella phage VLC4]UEW68118.1 hypothetical protein [Klebsiella phage vB_KpnM-VAC25]UVX28953.1 hypothetical protein A1p_00021 [Klebsiella phage VLCpiA1p]
MKAVNIVVKDKGWNCAARDLTLGKVYPAIRTEAGEEDSYGTINSFTSYELVDDVGDGCGIYLDYDGVVIEEV